MESNERILIVGLGELGAAMLRGLLAKIDPNRIAVLLRPQAFVTPSPERALTLDLFKRLGIEVVNADLASETIDTLAGLFAPFSVVVGCTGYASSVPVQRKICEAVLKAEVKRYIPWQFGVDYDVIGRGSAQELFDEQLDVRDLLRKQEKTKWMIVSTGMFVSFLFEPELGIVDLKNASVRALGRLDNALTVTTAEDIGTLTAEALFADAPITDSVVYLAGDTTSYEGLAQILERVFARQFSRSVWTIGELERALATSPNDQLAKYRLVFGQGRGVSWPKEKSFNWRLRLPALGIDDWLRGHAKEADGPISSERKKAQFGTPTKGL